MVPLPRPVPPILAVGAFLKNTLCLAHGSEALISRDVGNLETVEAVRAFDEMREAAAGDGRAACRSPSRTICTPTSTAPARPQAFAARMGVDAVPVQHHHAHVAAVMAEHGIEEPTLGLALDGFGLGPDDEAWGGELLLVDADGYRRLGRLAPPAAAGRRPGGARAVADGGGGTASRWAAATRSPRRFAGMRGAEVIARMLRAERQLPDHLELRPAVRRRLRPARRQAGRQRSRARRRWNWSAWRPIPSSPRPAGGCRTACSICCRCSTAWPGSMPRTAPICSTAPWRRRWRSGSSAAAEATGLRRVAFSGGCFLNRVLSAGAARAAARPRHRVLQPVRLAARRQRHQPGPGLGVAMARS